MTVLIAATISIYSLFMAFNLFAVVKQFKSVKHANLRNRCPPKKLSLFRHQQTKIILANTVKSFSIWIFALAFLLTDLSGALWSLNQTLSKILSYYGFYDNSYEVWTVVLPILTLYLLYEIHFYLFQWILKPNSEDNRHLPLSLVNRISLCIIGLYVITRCILVGDTNKIFSLFAAFSLGRLIFPFFKYHYVIYMYPVRPMCDPWLRQETADIAKRNKITVKQVLIVKYPYMQRKSVQCLYGNLLVDSRLLQWPTDFDWDLPSITILHGNYAPTISQKEARAMITHALGHWVNYHHLKTSLVFICQLAGMFAAITSSSLLSTEIDQPFPIKFETEVQNEADLSALLQERQLRTTCMGVLAVFLCFIFPLANTIHWINNIYWQQLDVDADLFTLANFQGQQMCQLLEKKVPAKRINFHENHWAYQILYPKREAMIVDRIAILKKRLKKTMYF